MMAITSTFDSGDDGWTMQGDVASSGYQPTGGDPGGYFAWVDAVLGNVAYYAAGPQYLGNQSAYYGGTLSYSIEDTGNNFSGDPNVELIGKDGLTLIYNGVQPPAGVWTAVTVSLTAAGWETPDGTPATAAQMQDVLGNLSELLIRAEYETGPETGGLDNVSLACYCPGTLIATDRGGIAVEALKIGDLVVTRSGASRPIKWIGRRSYSGRFISKNPSVLPICIKAGAFEKDIPARDLWISPHHAMYLDGMLIEAKDLVNEMTIFQAERTERVDYYHIELDSHDVILAEGAWAESFIDDDSRGIFHNAHEFAALYPAEEQMLARYCAPRVEQGDALMAVRARIDGHARHVFEAA